MITPHTLSERESKFHRVMPKLHYRSDIRPLRIIWIPLFTIKARATIANVIITTTILHSGYTNMRMNIASWVRKGVEKRATKLI